MSNSNSNNSTATSKRTVSGLVTNVRQEFNNQMKTIMKSVVQFAISPKPKVISSKRSAFKKYVKKPKIPSSGSAFKKYKK